MSEKQMWAVLRPVLVLWDLDPQRIETPASKGTPDVNYVHGWIELKNIENWPRKPDAIVKLDHYTPEQRVWGMKRTQAGGLSWVLLRVAKTKDWLLFDGNIAATHLGKVNKENLFTVARVCVKSPLDLTILREPRAR